MGKKKQEHEKQMEAQREVPPVQVAQKGKKWYLLALKFMALVAVAVAVVLYTDSKGYFNPNDLNDHTKKKWEAFYKFTEKDTVDVVLIGNSHCYAGINPKNLSAALGCNCFVLASPGTSVVDSYFCLEEALQRTKPGMVILETYGIGDTEVRKQKNGELSDQIKSFSARKNLGKKLASTPFLFDVENYLAAWSTSVRNHDFLFRNREQIRNNIELMKKPKKEKEKLYLGRFVAFSSGLTDSTLAKYDSLGAPVDGALREVNEENALYVQKIMDLCDENDIRLVFVTVPMYHKHVKNYADWHNTVAKTIQRKDVPWLDMQMRYDTAAYRPLCFENTYGGNQHTTHYGSVLFAYRIANFIADSVDVQLPRRSQDSAWHKMFYGEEGYFENYPSKDSDTTNVLIAKGLTLGAYEVPDCILSKRKEADLMLLKVSKDSLSHKALPESLDLLLEVEFEGRRVLTMARMMQAPQYRPLKHGLFLANLRKDIRILSLKNLMDVKQN